MKKYLAATIMLICLLACEADLQVHTDEFKPTPVVYCLLNPIDSIHKIRLSKSISANTNPLEQINDPGNMTFESADIRIRLISSRNDTLFISPEKASEIDKNLGLFGDNTHSLYYFKQEMTRNYISLFKKIEMEIDIPGYPTIKGSSDILIRPRIRWPNIYAQYLFVDPLRPLLVQWYGGSWNEVDIQFNIMEQYRDSTGIQSFCFEEKSNILMKEGICNVTFPYELIIQNIKRTLDPRKDLIRRYFGPVMIDVHTGNKDFAMYMDTKNGINDFTGNTISNLENAMGFLACQISYSFEPLYFDYFTRQRFVEDPELKIFKFKEY